MRSFYILPLLGLTLTATACTSSGEPTGPLDVGSTGADFDPSQPSGASGGMSNGGTSNGGTSRADGGASSATGGAGGTSTGHLGGQATIGTNTTTGDEGGWGGPPPMPSTLPSTPVIAARPPPAVSGGTLAVSPDGALAVAADPDRNKIYVIDLTELSSRTISLAPGTEPGRVTFDGQGRAHIVLRALGKLLAIDPQNATTLRQTAVCAHPRGAAYRAADDTLLVSCADGDLVRLAASDYTERARSFVELDLRDVLVTKDQRTFVSTFRSAELIQVDDAGLQLSRRAPATARMTRVDQVGAREVSFVPHVAWRAILGADGDPLLLHQRSLVEPIFVSERGGYGGGPIIKPCAAVTQFTISKPLDDAPRPGVTLASAVTAVDVASSPDGRWIAIASAGSTLQGQPSLQIHSAVGLTDLTSSPEGCRPPSAAKESAQATSVSFDPSGRVLVLTREPVKLEIFTIGKPTAPSDEDAGIPIAGVEVSAISVLFLDSESVRDAGNDLFHGDAGGGLACASCHPEGRDDGHTWTFAGIGPRRTQNFRGGLKVTAPFHWAGDLPTFQRLVDETMTKRMGGFIVSEAYSNALLNWMDGLPALKLPARDAAAVARGKELFETSQCTTCHSGDRLTTNQTVNVATEAVQVPSLRGLGLRAPFMHDGCAKDLAARFEPTCGGGDLHGKTSTLTQEQIADLVAYLSTL